MRVAVEILPNRAEGRDPMTCLHELSDLKWVRHPPREFRYRPNFPSLLRCCVTRARSNQARAKGEELAHPWSAPFYLCS
jgi:hypothetical protein